MREVEVSPPVEEEVPEEVVVASEAPEEVVPEEPVTPAPVRTREGCPGEWVDTWLWELCRDREQERAGMGRGVGADAEREVEAEAESGKSWVPGI
ncbi:hypothetical protein ACIBI7_51595 [Nonomuraea fuscirosea]|uniref:hypothetical protein n=1 Tax=Nonomuraea fuscirosea TaxID=1291556 RepID=UPI0037AF61C9